MARRQGPVNFDRRKFMKMAAAAGVSCAATDMFPNEFVQAQTTPQGRPAKGMQLLQSACPYCGVGCSVDILTKGEAIVGVHPAMNGPANEGALCIKGQFAYDHVQHAERLKTPMVRASDGKLVFAFAMADPRETKGIKTAEDPQVVERHISELRAQAKTLGG